MNLSVPVAATIPAGAPHAAWTVAQVRSWLERELENGVTCPCCNQHAKLYHRPFNSGMALCLVWLVRMFTETEHEGYIHVPSTASRAVLRNREFDKLGMHGVAETTASDDPSKRTSGYWRPTAHGIAVVKAGAKVCKTIDVYNGNVISRSGELVTIREALGAKFNYEELMTDKPVYSILGDG